MITEGGFTVVIIKVLFDSGCELAACLSNVNSWTVSTFQTIYTTLFVGGDLILQVEEEFPCCDEGVEAWTDVNGFEKLRKLRRNVAKVR